MIDMDMDGKGRELYPHSLWKTVQTQYPLLERLIIFQKVSM